VLGDRGDLLDDGALLLAGAAPAPSAASAASPSWVTNAIATVVANRFWISAPRPRRLPSQAKHSR